MYNLQPAHYHNQYIDKLVKNGVVGLVLFLSLLLTPLWLCSKEHYAKYITISLCTLLAIASLTDVPFNHGQTLFIYMTYICILNYKPSQRAYKIMVKIFIINLPTSTDRKKNISEQLSSMNLEYHLFPAVNGKTDNHPLLSHYDDGLSQKFRSKSLTKGQLGCYASHYLLWEKCVKLNEPIIVIEDDALIYPVPF